MSEGGRPRRDDLLYDLKRDPRYVIDKPFHSLHFYVPRSALDGISLTSQARRASTTSTVALVGHDDAIVRHIGASFAAQHCAGRTKPTSFSSTT